MFAGVSCQEIQLSISLLAQLRRQLSACPTRLNAQFAGVLCQEIQLFLSLVVSLTTKLSASFARLTDF